MMNGTSGAHERHDRTLVAALAADDLDPLGRAAAEAQVAACHDCAELLADLRVIARATAALPAIPRTRDFRVTAADAARLRPTGWRALLEVLGGARSSFSRPLAVGLTTLGLVGVLATTIPGALSGGFGAFGSAASSPAREGNPAAAAPLPSMAVASLGDTSGSPLFGPQASVAPSQGSAKVVIGSPGLAGDQSVQAVATARPEAGGLGAQPPGTKGGRGTGPGATEASGATTDQVASDGSAYSIGGHEAAHRPCSSSRSSASSRASASSPPAGAPGGSPAADRHVRRLRADPARLGRVPLAGTLTVSDRPAPDAPEGPAWIA